MKRSNAPISGDINSWPRPPPCMGFGPPRLPAGQWTPVDSESVESEEHLTTILCTIHFYRVDILHCSLTSTAHQKPSAPNIQASAQWISPVWVAFDHNPVHQTFVSTAHCKASILYCTFTSESEVQIARGSSNEQMRRARILHNAHCSKNCTFCTMHTAHYSINWTPYFKTCSKIQDCTLYNLTVRFQMKMVQYLLHNGDGNGLGDWGKIWGNPVVLDHPAHHLFGQTRFLPKVKYISAKVEIYFIYHPANYLFG